MHDTLKTERLILRPLRESDAPALSKYANDYDISRMTGTFPHPFPLLSAEFKVMHLLSKRRRGLAFPYAITENGTDMIGSVDLFRSHPDSVLEIGYWIGRPAWGKGYITEACRTFLSYAAHSLGARVINAGVFFDNAGSMKVLDKLGFEKTGETDMYFSIARQKRAMSILLKLDMDTAKPGFYDLSKDAVISQPLHHDEKDAKTA